MLITDYAVKTRTAVLAFIVVAALLGAANYATLPREGAPDITFPYVFVTAAYEGVAPGEIENLITIPLERRLGDLSNVDEMLSTSAEGVAFVVIKFTPKESLDSALQRVKDKIDAARPDLPGDLDEPFVDVFNMSSDLPILVPVLSGNVAPEVLKTVAEDIQDKIEDVPGVRQVGIVGTREREIRIVVDPRLMAMHGVSMGAIMRAVAVENRTISAGNLEIEGGKFQVRVPGEFKLVHELENVVVSVREGKAVYLTDVARIEDTLKDVTSLSRMNGEPSVSLQVKKRSGENTVRIIRDIKRQIGDFPLPPGVALTMTQDQSEWIISMVQELENNVISGFLLVVLVLVVFMGWSNSLFVAISIPLSMLIAFTVMNMQGLTLNFIVLFSLVMATGMLVDNGIVIVERIYSLRTAGMSRIESAKTGAGEVAWPVITSTLTTILAFSPLLYWPDVMGQFMGFLPKTLIITLSASLFVGIVASPAMCSLYIRAGKNRDTNGVRSRMLNIYERIAGWAIRNKGAVMISGIAFFIFTVALYVVLGRGIELFPDTQPRSAIVGVTYPQGTGIETTDATLTDIEDVIRTIPDVKFFVTSVGSSGSHVIGGGDSGTHLGSVYVEFQAMGQRSEDSRGLVRRIRSAVRDYPGAEIVVDREKEGPPTGAPVSIEIAGEDFDMLSRLAAETLRVVKMIPGVVDVRDDLEEAMPELQVRMDRKRAALLGADTSQVGDFLRSAVFGTACSKFRAGEEEYDITVRLPEPARMNADILRNLIVPLEGGGSVPLSSVAEVTYSGGLGKITRKDQKRVVTISGDRETRSIDAVLADVRRAVGAIRMPAGYSVKYTGENKEMNESGLFLLKALGFAVALIFIVLVIQFNSSLLPIIILVSVVLSMIGVLWGLMLTRMKFGVIMTGVGVISLAGVIVNNSIVLVDCILRRRMDGMSACEAALAAGRQRVRPVLLTAGTTILGLIPMAVGWSVEFHRFPWRIVAGAESSDWWAPMAVAIIFGLGFATMVTLIQVPVVYCALEALKERVMKRNSQD